MIAKELETPWSGRTVVCRLPLDQSSGVRFLTALLVIRDAKFIDMMDEELGARGDTPAPRSADMNWDGGFATGTYVGRPGSALGHFSRDG